MPTFQEFELAVEQLDRASRALRERMSLLKDGFVVTPIVRASLLSAADDVEAACEGHVWSKKPIDMLQDEWDVDALRLLRAASATVYGRATMRAKDFGDWCRDLELALAEYTVAKERFDRDVER
ncbi:MAG: hypothetical protein ACI81R_000046 [Bradymonadia bacterium]|jgi:hypothetical protein